MPLCKGTYPSGVQCSTETSRASGYCYFHRKQEPSVVKPLPHNPKILRQVTRLTLEGIDGQDIHIDSTGDSDTAIRCGCMDELYINKNNLLDIIALCEAAIDEFF